MRIGVLALQGAFTEHEQILTRIGAETVEVRLPQHLEGLDGLIIPGGESTTIGRVAERWGLLEPLRTFARSGRPLWGTCAGMILMAKQVSDGVAGQSLLALGKVPFHAVFIRAPLIERVGKGVTVLARLEGGATVAARQDNLLVTAFHPELADDDRFHRYFTSLRDGGQA
jgi:5'-phosphate synthase pdxT subunit